MNDKFITKVTYVVTEVARAAKYGHALPKGVLDTLGPASKRRFLNIISEGAPRFGFDKPIYRLEFRGRLGTFVKKVGPLPEDLPRNCNNSTLAAAIAEAMEILAREDHHQSALRSWETRREAAQKAEVLEEAPQPIVAASPLHGAALEELLAELFQRGFEVSLRPLK